MNLSNKILYFLGIGGIGMSALARWCAHQGAKIYGYDLQPTKLTEELINEGMLVHFTSDINLIPKQIDFVVYTPAIPTDNVEYVYLRESGVQMIKRAELIGKISHSVKTIAIAGTHGKTSITALTAHILKNANLNISAFVGGICRNYDSNLILSDSFDYFVIEADEYDRSLLQIEPDIAVISSMDEDHLDIYSDKDDIKNTFIEFSKKIVDGGVLIYNDGIDPFTVTNVKNLSYGTSNSASNYASNIRIEEGVYIIDIHANGKVIKDIHIQVPGMHNIENTLASTTIGLELGLSPNQIKSGIETFLGVERRMDYRIKNNDVIYIDDYAHHPEEIKVTIETVKELYPNKKITGIFQPHLYSRTRDFAAEFAEQLSKLDELLLLDIYPAREKPIPGVTSEIISDKILDCDCKLLMPDEIINYLSNNSPEVILTMGAGDINLMVEKIENALI